MKLAVSCVIEQHIEKRLATVEPTNLRLGIHRKAALIVRCVGGWSAQMAQAEKATHDAEVIFPIVWRTSIDVHTDPHAWRWRGELAPTLQQCVLLSWHHAIRYAEGCDGLRAVQVMFVLALVHAFSRTDDELKRSVTRIGLQDDKTGHGVQLHDSTIAGRILKKAAGTQTPKLQVRCVWTRLRATRGPIAWG